jgi:hypothetical protein
MDTKQQILYLTEQMSAAGFVFNGMQVYDHLRVLEICSILPSLCYVHVRRETSSREEFEESFIEVVKEVIEKFVRGEVVGAVGAT